MPREVLQLENSLGGVAGEALGAEKTFDIANVGGGAFGPGYDPSFKTSSSKNLILLILLGSSVSRGSDGQLVGLDDQASNPSSGIASGDSGTDGGQSSSDRNASGGRGVSGGENRGYVRN